MIFITLLLSVVGAVFPTIFVLILLSIITPMHWAPSETLNWAITIITMFIFTTIFFMRLNA